MQNAGPQPRSSSALSLLCDRVVGVSKLAFWACTTSQPPAAFQSPRDAGDRALGGLKVPSIYGLLHSSEFAPTTCFIILAAPADCGPVQRAYVACTADT